MRKITLMCSLFFTASLTAFAEVGEKITSLDQLSNDKVYTITPKDGNRGTWCYDKNNPNVLTSTTRTGDEINMSDVNQQFAFLKSESGRLFVYSIGAQKFFSKGSDVVSLVSEISNENVLSSILNSTNSDKANYPWVVAVNGSQLNLCNPGSSDPSGVVLWNDLSDNGNSICITEAGNFEQNENVINYIQEIDKKFDIVEEANAYLKVPANSVGGYSAMLWNALNEACGSDGKAEFSDLDNPDFETALNNIKAGTPIEFSNDKVYKIQNYVPSNGFLMSRKEATDTCRIFASAKASELAEIENSEKWQLYFDGVHYLLYNQGTSKYVQYVAEAQFPTTKDLWLLVDEPTYVNVQKNENKGKGAYTIQDPNCTGHYQYMHVNNSQTDISGVKGWETSADATNFYFIETEGTAIDLASVALNKVKQEGQTLIDSYIPDPDHANYVGNYSSASIDALRNAINDVNATVESIQVAIDNVKASKQPQVGKYYILQNTFAFNDGQTKTIFESADGTNIAWNTKAEGAAELWQFESNGNGKFYLKSANTGKYVTVNNGFKMQEAQPTNYAIYLVEQSDVDIYTFGLRTSPDVDYTMALSTADGPYKKAGADATNGNYVSTYNGFGNDCPTKWNIIEATSIKQEIKEVGYATAWFPCAVNIPSGVEVYYVSSTENGYAVLQQVTDVIPAKSAVILKGAKGIYTFEISVDQSLPTINGNCLNGTSIATTLSESVNAYVLANGSKGVGFYILENSNDVETPNRTVAANKAYLTIAEPNGIKAFTFDFGGTTGIDKPQTAVESEEYYDLQGRRVMNPTKGIYVTKSGKKVLFTK